MLLVQVINEWCFWYGALIIGASVQGVDGLLCEIGVVSVVVVCSSGETLLEVKDVCWLEWSASSHLIALAIAQHVRDIRAAFTTGQ